MSAVVIASPTRFLVLASAVSMKESCRPSSSIIAFALAALAALATLQSRAHRFLHVTAALVVACACLVSSGLDLAGDFANRRTPTPPPPPPRPSTSTSTSTSMSKLSPSLKALINAPFARPGPTPASARIADVYRSIARDAASHNIGAQPWLTFSAAATMTLNAPDALATLWRVASEPPVAQTPVAAAELIREVGLKCIGFNGIPRTINVLGAFRSALPVDVYDALSTVPTRNVTAANVEATRARGLGLWRSVYAGVDAKLIDKLSESHPDLPVHILGSHYGPLFTDPPDHGANGLASVGRALTSLVAIACLRAQTGVGPQVVSHVFGLRKAVADGSWRPEGASTAEAESVRGVDWLATNEGSEWLLASIDQITEALGGSNFASPDKAKL